MSYILPKEGDPALAEAVRDGNEQAFTRLYEIYGRPLTYFVDSLIRDAAEAQAIVSETFEKIWRLRANFQTMEDLRAFMYVTSRNAAYNYNRDMAVMRKREMLPGDLEALTAYQQDNAEDVDAELKMLKTELFRQILAEIQLLPTQRKNVLLLLLRGLDVAEVADRLNISETSVRTARHKAIHQIRQKLPHLKWLLIPLFMLEEPA